MALTPLYTQDFGITDVNDRRILSAAFSPGIRKKNFPNDLLPTSTGGMNISVAGGLGFIQGSHVTDQGIYPFYSSASEAMTVTNNSGGANPRIDRLYFQVLDNDIIGSGNTEIVLGRVQGVVTVGAAGATDPDWILGIGNLPSSAWEFARVRVPAGATSITSSDIKDLRAIAANTSNPAVRAYNSATQSISNNAAMVALTANSELFDTEGIHSISTNTSRLTAVTPGIYSIVTGVSWSSQTVVSQLVELEIVHSVDGVIAGVSDKLEKATAVEHSPDQNISTTYKLAAGEYIYAQARQVNDVAASRPITLKELSMVLMASI